MYGAGQEQKKTKENEVALGRSHPGSDYCNYSGVGLMQRNSHLESGFNPETDSVPAHYGKFVVDSFQSYRGSQDPNLSPYRTSAKAEPEYRSPSLENSPDNYTHSSEIRSLENHSNSMNMPFKNMDIRSRSMDSPVLGSRSRGQDSPITSFAVLDNVEQSPNSYHLTGLGEKEKEFQEYEKQANFSSSEMFNRTESR